MPRPTLDEIYAAYEAQKDPFWVPKSTEEFWRNRINSDAPIGVAQAASADEFLPEMDLLDYSAFMPGVGDVTGPMADVRYLWENAEQRTPENFALASLGLLPFVGSLRGVKNLPPLWHGTVSQATGGITNPNTIANQGFTRGYSSELNIPGTSVSRDPMVSIFDFGDANALKNTMLRVEPTVDPSEVINLPPDLYRSGIQTEDPTALYLKPGMMKENELFAKRDVTKFDVPVLKKLNEYGVVPPHFDLYGNDLSKLPEALSERLGAAIEDAYETIDFTDPRYRINVREKLARSMPEVFRQSFMDWSEGLPSDMILEEAGAFFYPDEPGGQILKNMTTTAASYADTKAAVPTLAPRIPTESEYDFLAKEAKAKARYSTLNFDLTFAHSKYPERDLAKFVETFNATKGNRGSRTRALDDFAGNVVGRYGMWNKLQHKEGFAELEKAARELQTAKHAFHNIESGLVLRDPDKIKGMYLPKTVEELEKYLEEGGKMADVGDPVLRQAYRDYNRAKDRFDKMLNTFALGKDISREAGSG